MDPEPVTGGTMAVTGGTMAVTGGTMVEPAAMPAIAEPGSTVQPLCTAAYPNVKVLPLWWGGLAQRKSPPAT